MKNIIFVLSLLFVFACATAERMDKLKVGMTRTEVIKVMKGEPDVKTVGENKEYLSYHLVDPYWGGDWYTICLKDGKVSAYGRRSDFGKIDNSTTVKIDQ